MTSFACASGFDEHGAPVFHGLLRNAGQAAGVLKKLFLLLLLPAGIASAPVVLFSAPKWWSKITAAISPKESIESPPAVYSPAPSGVTAPVHGKPEHGKNEQPAQGPPPVSDHVPIFDLAEVLRFDISPNWVIARWPRVSASLAQLQLQGYRVPLVTGTAEHDLAGSLTYYFDPRQRLQRITFQGVTGDPRKLLELLTTRHGFARRLTNDPSSFVYEVPGTDKKAKSVLWIRPARVVKAEESCHRFQVALVMERAEQSE